MKGELAPELYCIPPSTSSIDPGHLPGVPEEALQQHDQEAANGSHVQVRDVQVIIYDKKR